MQQERDDAAHVRRLRRSMCLAAAALLALLLLAEWRGVPHGITLNLFLRQDRIVLLAYVLSLLGLAFVPTNISPREISGRLRPFHVIAAAGVLTLILWGGTHFLLGNYAFTRDEQMVLFDAAIFREFHLAAPLDPQWRTMAASMAPLYALVFPDDLAWSSAYLPGNAALRSLISFVADPGLTNPLLAGIGGWFLYLAARRLFPNSRSTVATVLIVYFTSAQMIVGAMTPFAMTGHMTLNLLWLVLFLRGGRLGHGGALVTGFVATGLHQIVFHPLFVLPFIDHLRRKGEWRTALLYLLAYGAIGIFWMSYQSLVMNAAGAVATGPAGAGLPAFIQERILPLLIERDPNTFALTAFNLLRTVAWQNLVLLPLLICAFPLVRRDIGIARPLFLGIVLTLGVVALLLPYQSIGWGYRYVHGLLGSFALLAGYGWQAIEGERTCRRFLVAGTIVTLCLAMPFLLWQTRKIIEPALRVERAIARIDADFVVIDPPGLAETQVRNDPFLRNRPLRFSSQYLSPADLNALCLRGSVAFVGRAQMQRLGLAIDGEPPESQFLLLRRSAPACASQ